MPDKKIDYNPEPLLRGFAKITIRAGIAAAPYLISGKVAEAASAVLEAVGDDLPEGIWTTALEGISLKDQKGREALLNRLKKELPKALNTPDFELPESVRTVLLSNLLTPEHLFDLLSQSKQNWHGQLKAELLSVCRANEQTAMSENLADAITKTILDGCEEIIRKDHELQEALVLHAEFQEKIESPVHMDNVAYANSFLQPLFLHKDSPDYWQMTLRNLYVMPAYTEGRTTRNNLREKLQDFLCSDNNIPLLLIEGGAGTGKTTLSAWLNYQYQQQLKEDAEKDELFDGRSLVTVRLRDLAGRAVIGGQLQTLVMQYLRVKSIEELERQYPRLILLLDGFDELCMMKMVAKGQKDFFNQLYDTARKQKWKLIVTSRPEYFDPETLGQRAYERITLAHFDKAKRKEWMGKYDAHSSVPIPEEMREYIQQLEDSDTEGVCDTPMMLYMLTADEETGRYKKNTWALYRHVFGTVMSRTKYNEVFPDADGTAPHRVSAVRRILYRVTEEIAFTMFRNSSEQFFLQEDALHQILTGLRDEFPELEDADTERLVERCYGLCCYWKTRNSGCGGQGYYASLDEDLDEDLLPDQMCHQGAVEFLHNNIRDFFLAEKLYRELNRTAVARQTGMAKDYTAMTDTLCRLLWYDELPGMVLAFIQQRARYEKGRRRDGGAELLDFAGFEVEQSRKLPGIQREIALILRDLSGNGICGNGGDRPGVLNPASPLPLRDRILHIVKNTIAIYRSACDPYLEVDETICWCPLSEEELALRREKDSFSPETHWDRDPSQLVNALFSELFRRSDLGRRGDFSGADLTGANLRWSVLKTAHLNGAHLIRADLTEADLNSACLIRANLKGAYLERANLKGVHLNWANLEGANLYGVDLPGADLTGANLEGANLKGANLKGAILNLANLKGANLKGATLIGTNLESAVLEGARLYRASLCNANLYRANLYMADLREAYLTGADLTGADLCYAILPDGFSSSDQEEQVAHLKSLNIEGLKI